MKSRIAKVGFEIEMESTDEVSNYLGEVSTTEGGSLHGDGSIRRCDELENHERKVCNIQEGEVSPAEFSSAPYKISELSTKAYPIFDKLQELWNQKKMCANKSTGFHVHASFFPVIPVELVSVKFTEFFRRAMKKRFPDEYSKRYRNNYCRYVKYTNHQILYPDKYKAINFNHLNASPECKTIEFRIFPANEPLLMKQYLEFTAKTINDFIRIANNGKTLKVRHHFTLKDSKKKGSTLESCERVNIEKNTFSSMYHGSINLNANNNITHV